MAKNLKLNIKNLQLAGALKPKKSPSSQKEETKPSSKQVTRLKDDVGSSLASSEKVDESKKRKTRLVQTPQEEEEKTTSPETLEKAEETVQEENKSSSKEAPSTTEEKSKEEPSKTTPSTPAEESSTTKEAPKKGLPPKEFRPQKKKAEIKTFDSRDRQGLRDVDNEAWRKRRAYKRPQKRFQPEEIVRPKSLSIRLPITIKDLAQEMKLKASQLIAKLFMQGMTLTLNDCLDDEVVVQLLGQEFDCEIKIDTTEEKRIQITDQTIREEIEKTAKENLELRAPVVAFMGHVDHGKTSLIDAIRKSNRVAGEAGAITQHIGAFKVKSQGGEITILDTPGHEAFFEMRSRGANVTDLVILVIAGDEGIKPQTDEAISQAREANVPILVAVNKADKDGFDAEKIYRELSERNLLPEAWGGTTITVNCSAATNQGIPELLEMIALQSEILELRANPSTRARGTVLESEMHKGLGAVATVLVQNGTLKKNDAIVFGHYSGRIKTMHDEHNRPIEEAGPSTPVKITGLSELALAGNEMIVVKNEREARELAEARAEGMERRLQAQSKVGSMEKMMAKKKSGEKKILALILKADVQGSLEALKTSLLKIESEKVRLEIVSADVGEISESDIELASASKATVVGFHTSIESNAEGLIKQKKVPVYSHDVIYHIIDEVRERMKTLLDKIEEEKDLGAALVKAVFKSSQLGLIAGCQITDGIIKRQNFVRQKREGEIIWKGKIASLKREKEDVKEVKEGFECGILLDGQKDIKEGDILEAFEIIYLEQEL